MFILLATVLTVTAVAACEVRIKKIKMHSQKSPQILKGDQHTTVALHTTRQWWQRRSRGLVPLNTDPNISSCSDIAAWIVRSP